MENPMILFKVQELARIIMTKKKLSISDSLLYLYSSRLYQIMNNEDAKMWYLSGLALYDMLDLEKRKERKVDVADAKIIDFQVFCVECYKYYKKISVQEVMRLFDTYKVFTYLKDGFDVLHSQGREYILSDIEEFINNREK